jgi:hypothetical protein
MLEVRIEFKYSRREPLAGQLNRVHLLAQLVSHIAILLADLAADACPRLRGL